MKLWTPDIPVVALIIRVAVVYFAIIVLLRIAGKRQVGQMGVPQFVALLLISNAVQNAMNGGDNSLIGGLILAAALICFSYFFEWVTFHFPRVENAVQGRPTLLIHHGKVLVRHLRRELLSLRELRTILRRQDVHDLSEVEEAVLESDGFISVVKRSEAQPQLVDD